MHENEFELLDVDHGYYPHHELCGWLNLLARGISCQQFAGEQLLALNRQTAIVASGAWLKHENIHSFHSKTSPSVHQSARSGRAAILFCDGIFAWHPPLVVV